MLWPSANSVSCWCVLAGRIYTAAAALGLAGAGAGSAAHQVTSCSCQQWAPVRRRRRILALARNAWPADAAGFPACQRPSREPGRGFGPANAWPCKLHAGVCSQCFVLLQCGMTLWLCMGLHCCLMGLASRPHLPLLDVSGETTTLPTVCEAVALDADAAC